MTFNSRGTPTGSKFSEKKFINANSKENGSGEGGGWGGVMDAKEGDGR